MLEKIIPEPPDALSEPLLGGRAVAVTVGIGVALFGASVPLVGWEQALGSLLAAFAGLLLAVALAEPLVHRLQGIIEARNVATRQRAVAVDVLRIIGSPVWSLAKVAIPNWDGRRLPDQVDAGAVLKILDEAEGRLRDAETRALARSGGWIRPDLSDEEAAEVGLPGAWDRWWCADAIALSLEPVRYELSGRVHAAGVEEQIAQAIREICFSLQPTWQFQADKGPPPVSSDEPEPNETRRDEKLAGPTPGAFLHAASETFAFCRFVLERIEASTVLNVEVPLLPQRQAGDPYLTTWEAVSAEVDRAQGT